MNCQQYLCLVAFNTIQISSDQGILISGWSAECDGSVSGIENKSLKELSECARKNDLGKVTANVWVDNRPIAQVKAEDLKTTNLINATELSTKDLILQRQKTLI